MQEAAQLAELNRKMLSNTRLLNRYKLTCKHNSVEEAE